MGLAAKLEGQRFDRLLVIDRVGLDKYRRGALWRCVCDCGTERLVATNVLRTGKAVSCGRRNHRYSEQERLERSRASARRWRLRKYGLTQEQFDAILASQHGCCAICFTPLIGTENQHIDHNHFLETDAVRGILCTYCNTMLGHARDDETILRRAADYIKNKKATSVKDLAVTTWGDNNRGFTAITPKGAEWLNAEQVREKANRIWANGTLIVGPDQAIPLLQILERQSDVSVLVEP